MTYSAQVEKFRNDKNSFFNQPKKSESFDAIDKEVKGMAYSDILANQKLFEAEFKHLFTVLQKQKNDKDKQVFWNYCYYCASILEAYHLAYSNKTKNDDYNYTEIKEQIKNRLNKPKVQADSTAKEKAAKEKEALEEKSFIQTLYAKFLKGIKDLFDIPFHVVTLRKEIGFINLCRIYWVFTRLTLTQALTVASDFNLITKLDEFLGTHTDVNKIITALQAPTKVLNFFSVGLFMGRFLLDAAMLLKHTCFPSDLEAAIDPITRQQDLSKASTWTQRLQFEWEKRHWGFANDIAWAAVNFLTNFNQVAHVAASASGFLIAGFLTFDIAMLVYKIHLEERVYLNKKAQYLQDIEDYKKANNHLFVEMTRLQLVELERDWKVTQSTLYFVAAAAIILAAGFSATLIAASPVVVLAMYLVSLIGVAMFLSYPKYATYKAKSLLLEELELANKDTGLVRKEFEIARREFFFTMVKNTIVPLVLVSTFAICWPAALVLTTLYLGYEFYHAYQQYQAGKEAKNLALPPVEFEPTADLVMA
ncbi:MAG: hypothetical protein WC627_01800 [Legionella sp.]|jgi:hypothetical protein